MKRLTILTMKRLLYKSLHSASALLLLALGGSLAKAADIFPPGKIAFQGFLTDSSQAPLGSANPVKATVTFRLYKSASGSAASDGIWAEKQIVVVDKGQYTALLGNGMTTGLGGDFFTNNLSGFFIGPEASDRFLGITLQGQQEIKPRIQFFASPFAQASRAAGMLVGASGKPFVTAVGNTVGVNLSNAPTATLEVNGTLKASSFSGSAVQLTGVSVSAGNIVGTLAGSQIADGSIGGNKLALQTVGSNQLANASITADKISSDALASIVSQVGGIGSGGIILSSNPTNSALLNAGFVNLGPSTVDGDRWSVKAFVGAPNAPAPRRTELGMSSDMQLRMSVWTGSKWIIWGGINPAQNGDYRDGAIFDPVLGTWTTMSTLNNPVQRREFQTAWTGSKYLIWGGFDGGAFGDGKQYDPATDIWTNISSTNAPAPRTRHSGVWTGTEWIIWGGLTGGASGFNSGAIYNPTTDTWRSMADCPLTARWDHCAHWTGTEMIIYGGEMQGASGLQDGARYNPTTDTWTPIPFGPSGTSQGTSVWTGKEFIYFSGLEGGAVKAGGGRYDPISNTWKKMSAGYSSFLPRYKCLTVWTGYEMVALGGFNIGGSAYTDSARYNPATDTWTLLAPFGGQKASVFYTWTGSEMLFMGFYNDGGNNAVYSYRPPRENYLYAKP